MSSDYMLVCEWCKKPICKDIEFGGYRCEEKLKVYAGYIYCLDCAPVARLHVHGLLAREREKQ